MLAGQGKARLTCMWECLCGHRRPTPRHSNGQKHKWHWTPRSSQGKNESGHSFQVDNCRWLCANMKNLPEGNKHFMLVPQVPHRYWCFCAFNHDESVDQIDFESAVDLIESCLHNSGLAKWRHLRGVDVDYIQWWRPCTAFLSCYWFTTLERWKVWHCLNLN